MVSKAAVSVRGSLLNNQSSFISRNSSHTEGMQSLFASVPGKRRSNTTTTARNAPASAAGVIIRSGYLLKKGKINKAFKLRWCVLQDNKLHYYKSTDTPKPEGSIALDQAYVKFCTPDEGEEHGFQVVTPARVFVLVAKSKSEMLDWVQSLSQQTVLALENEKIEKAEETICKATEYSVRMGEEKIIAQLKKVTPPARDATLKREDSFGDAEVLLHHTSSEKDREKEVEGSNTF